MEAAEIKKSFEEQIVKTEKQIKELEENLVKAKEYKIKLQGGLETLELLNQESPEEINNTETQYPV